MPPIFPEGGGKGGIRTPGTLRYTRFPVVHLRPLGHLSLRAEREGFEPPVPLRVRLISNQVHSTGLCHLSILRVRLAPAPPHPAKPDGAPPRYPRRLLASELGEELR